jgi:hypothetical protein
MDAETIAIIKGCEGRTFSEKLRNLVNDYARQNRDYARQAKTGFKWKHENSLQELQKRYFDIDNVTNLDTFEVTTGDVRQIES